MHTGFQGGKEYWVIMDDPVLANQYFVKSLWIVVCKLFCELHGMKKNLDSEPGTVLVLCTKCSNDVNYILAKGSGEGHSIQIVVPNYVEDPMLIADFS